MASILFRSPRYLSLAVLVILSLGLFSFNTIARQEDPTITNLFATVTTPFPGADPARVESLVTEKIEQELREIPEIDTISSTSRRGISVVQIELSMLISDETIEQTWSEIRDALSDATVEFPVGAGDPEFDNDRTGAFSLIATLKGREDGAIPLSLLSRFAQSLQDQLRQIPNTKRVRLYGEAEEEIRVTIDMDRLASLGLTVNQVANAISAADAKRQAGVMRGTANDLLIEIDGEIRNVERIESIPLTNDADGRIARIHDVATVRRAVAEPQAVIAYADGARSILIAAQIEDDRQVDHWAAAAREKLAAFEQSLPEGIEVQITFDQSEYTASRLAEVGLNMAIGVSLVVLVLYLTMGWRSALVVAAMLPLTALLSLVILEKIGITIHQMSVTGLIVALGLLVDAAIVTTDEIRRRIVAGTSPTDAISGAVKRLTIPLAASTVTTVLAFIPMAALPGPAGDFVGAIAISVIVMLIASLALALTITPALAGWMLSSKTNTEQRWWRDGLQGGAAGRLFSRSIDLSLRHPILAMATAALPAIVGFAAFPTLTAQFFPEVDRDQFHIQIEMGSGTSISRTEEAVLKANAILEETNGIRQLQWVIGRTAPAFYYNMLDNRDSDPTFAEALVSTTSAFETERLVPSLQRALDKALPEARVLVRGLKQGPPVDAPIELRLVGAELNNLRELGDMARAMMRDVDSITHARADLSGGAPKAMFYLDEEKVRLAGLDLESVANQLSALTNGATGGSLIEGPEELDVRVRLDNAERTTIGQLRDLLIVNQPTSQEQSVIPAVPLTALGHVMIEPSESTIKRRNGERINTVQAYLRHGILPDEAFGEFQALLEANPLPLPANYRIEWGGDSDARGETVRNLMSVVGLVVTSTIAVIVLTFNSWRLSFIAFAIAGLSMGLSLLALEIFGYPFGIQALIGVIGAIGVSINAAIIILTALQADGNASQGDTVAVRDVVMGSSRHIISTTVTTFGGFLPLILAGGGFWPPFAMAVAGGVLLSTIISFYFVPQAYVLTLGRKQKDLSVNQRVPSTWSIAEAA